MNRPGINRRSVLQGLGALLALPWLPACSQTPAPSLPAGSAPVATLDHPEAFWRDKVGAAAFAVLFNEDTEPAFSSPLDDEHRDGRFVCAACHLPLFDSKHKFDSGTGWPSFTRPLAGAMGTKRDLVLLIPRTEYHCARCGGHQGHVFNDGPPPRGERWCNNGLALNFVPREQPLPALRG